MIPSQVEDALDRRSRDVVIHDHGFAADKIPVSWFRDRLDAAGLEPRLFVGRDGLDRECITRGVLFDAASTALRDDGDDREVLALLWSVLAWGSDLSSRGNSRRVSAFWRENDRSRRVAVLRESAKLARDGEIERAYRMLWSRPTSIPGLGPSFFTKWLYFAGAGAIDHRALILDQRVGAALSVTWRSEARWRNAWKPALYVDYCDVAHEWAAEASTDMGRLVGGDEVEKALWLLGDDAGAP